MNKKRKPEIEHDNTKETKSVMADFKTDPFGSYTGVCKDKYEIPVQDADDL